MPTIVEPDSERNYVTVLADRSNADIASVDRTMVVERYKIHGAILFRGFELDLASLNSFTSKFCSGFLSNDSGGREFVSRDYRTQTVNLGREAFPLHSELSIAPTKPDIAWFMCVNAPHGGGETLICDGIPVVPALQPEVRASLDRRSLLYTKWIPAPDLEQWFGTPEPNDELLAEASRRGPWLFAREGNAYRRSHIAPALHKPMFSDRLAFGNFLLFARFGQNIRNFPTFDDGSEVPDAVCLDVKRVTDALTVAHQWQRNDLLMLDNTRFMHGRNAIENPAQRIIWSQFGYVEFAPLSEAERRTQPWRYRLGAPDPVTG